MLVVDFDWLPRRQEGAGCCQQQGAMSLPLLYFLYFLFFQTGVVTLVAQFNPQSESNKLSTLPTLSITLPRASVMIHFFPPSMFYTLHWHADAVQASWGKLFHLSYFPRIDADPVGVIVSHFLVAYAVWAIPFSIWMFVSGVSLHKNPKHETVFNSTMCGGVGSVVRMVTGTPADQWAQIKARGDWKFFPHYAIYLGVVHFWGSFATVFISVACWKWRWVHAAYLALILAVLTRNAANRYVYYMLGLTQTMIRKEVGIAAPAKKKRA